MGLRNDDRHCVENEQFTMDLSVFHNQFREETHENVRILSAGLLALERMSDQGAPDARAQIHAMFRAIHTIKGSARLLGFEQIGRLAHTMEHILDTVRNGHRMIDRTLANDLLRGADAILELTTAAVENRTASIDTEQLLATFAQSLADGESAVAQPETTRVSTTSAQVPKQSAAHQPAAKVDHPSAGEAPGIQERPDGDSNGTAGATQADAPARFQSRQANRQTVRVRVDRLDRLINLTGELVVGQQVLMTHVQALHELTKLIQHQERALLDLETELNQIRFSPTQRQILDDRLATLLHNGMQTRQLLNRQVDQFGLLANQQGVLVGDLEQEVMAARLLPVATVFAALPRAVRELAHAMQKEVVLEVSGETTEMDRKMLEALNDPLIHLIRNAVDHGIEMPDVRVAAGKTPEGRIRISAETYGGEVRIEISDDGRGMDPAVLRDVAVRKGLISAENVALLSDTEALELIFLPGFTTTPIITDISGRGVGMDVVRSNIGELGGQISIESRPGQGTRITLSLPLTLVTTRILLVKTGTQMFALPATGCRGAIWVHQQDIRTIEGRATVWYKQQTLPLLKLADLLHIESPPAFQHRERMPAVLIGNTQRQLGLLVDQLYDEREAVVKPLGALFEQRRRYSGAVQLGDGQLVLLLNPIILSQTARGMALTGPTTGITHERRRAHLLIADDSFTTRELIRSILQSAGYTVTVACDGLDALDKLRTQAYDLVISDVEMPRVNGFQLTTRIRQELGLQHLPVVIITSLASDEHRRKGLEVGAQAYIVKNQFNQDNLLEVVQQLLGH